MRRALASAFAIVGITFVAASAAVLAVRPAVKLPPAEPIWTEIKWPFALDQWGAGRAFACMPADCGVKADLYVRPKIGFCNCSTGVSDGAELERVGDTDLIGRGARPQASAHPIKVGWMTGLSRSYAASDEQSAERLLSVAFNDECDVVVALAVFRSGEPSSLEGAVIGFLNSTPMVLWAKKELGLEFVRREW